MIGLILGKISANRSSGSNDVLYWSTIWRNREVKPFFSTNNSWSVNLRRETFFTHFLVSLSPAHLALIPLPFFNFSYFGNWKSVSVYSHCALLPQSVRPISLFLPLMLMVDTHPKFFSSSRKASCLLISAILEFSNWRSALRKIRLAGSLSQELFNLMLTGITPECLHWRLNLRWFLNRANFLASLSCCLTSCRISDP